MAMVELSEEEVNIVPEPVLSHVDFESKTDFFNCFVLCHNAISSTIRIQRKN